VVLENGDELAYDRLILATGATDSYFGHDDWRAHAPGLKTHEAVVTHPRGPGITFEHSSYVPEGSPKQRLIIFTPCNEASAAKVREAIAETKSSGRRSPTQVN
jgi:NADH dehydrogenase